jgi:glutathione S-transferase
VSGGATHEAAFLAINPKAKVPTLMRDDGSVLTGFSAIATWLARTNPGQHLLADDPEEEARVIEPLSYIEGTLHGQGFARIFAPASFAPQGLVPNTIGLALAAVGQQGRELVETGFAILDRNWVVTATRRERNSASRMQPYST